MATNPQSKPTQSSSNVIIPASAVIPTRDQLQKEFNSFLDKILNIFTIEPGIKTEIKATMQKLNDPDKIQFMNNKQLQQSLLMIDTTIQTEYDKVKQYINDASWIEFLKNIIQLQVMVFLKKISLNTLIKPFEDALTKKVVTLVSTKQEIEASKLGKSKYLKYKKKYLALK